MVRAINMNSIRGSNRATLTFLAFLTLRGLLKLNRRNGVHSTIIELMAGAQNGFLLGQETSSLMLLLGAMALGDRKARARSFR